MSARHDVNIPLSAPIMTADGLHRAIDRLCYRVGAHVNANGMVTFPADREQCGDQRKLHDLDLLSSLRALTDDEREELFHRFCRGCFRFLEPGDTCHCTNDE